ncbi:MAG: ATP-binding region, ATPase-like [uncultured Sulfurovum sp.]|uniref:ATP-binding region, ATPase-like n=1 Tax=uncultured Sulfurovum sp. TaxID=269237 RepID=A0A6S6SR87_9BACT|nr:MAG: ATP-binding region, ATPase-like [uncultured Sulfurovum sp.]
MTNKEKGIRIRTQIIRDVIHHPNDISKHIANIFNITPQAVYNHIKRLEKEGYITSIGKGKGKRYTLGAVREYRVILPLTEDLSEDQIWRKSFAFIFEGIEENIVDICHYGFTEMVNNVIDHSDGKNVSLYIYRDKEKIRMFIIDDGEGIFKRIKRLCNLEDERHAIMELSKGKLTTDPENHTGEGIFFTSRMFDEFEIESKGLNYAHYDENSFDFLLDSELEVEEIGTMVVMVIDINRERLIKDVFDEYTEDLQEEGTSQFNKTVIPVKLAVYGNEKLVSRSQAKRLLTRVEKFKHVIFDFEDISTVGQAFADEIFRVYANKNKDIVLMPLNMNEDVNRMVQRALGN